MVHVKLIAAIQQGQEKGLGLAEKSTRYEQVVLKPWLENLQQHPELCSGYTPEQVTDIVKQNIVLALRTMAIVPPGSYTAADFLENLKNYVQVPIKEMNDWLRHEYEYWCIETGSDFIENTEKPLWL